MRIQDASHITLYHNVFDGINAHDVAAWFNRFTDFVPTWIEGYRPRSNYGTDKQMIEGVKDLSRSVSDSAVLDNTGVKKVIRAEVMQLLGLWYWPTPTHHADLRSAARIMLLGMYKDSEGNSLVYDTLTKGMLHGFDITKRDMGDVQ